MTVKQFYKNNHLDCICIRGLELRLNGLHSSNENTLQGYISNPKSVLLIISDMCLGVFLSLHQAYQLPYLEKQLKPEGFKSSVVIFSNLTQEFITNSEVTSSNQILLEGSRRGCQMIKIDSDWDTLGWGYSKICKLPKWLELVIQQRLTTPPANNYPPIEPDLPFLEAMGVETSQEENNHP